MHPVVLNVHNPAAGVVLLPPVLSREQGEGGLSACGETFQGVKLCV